MIKIKEENGEERKQKRMVEMKAKALVTLAVASFFLMNMINLEIGFEIKNVEASSIINVEEEWNKTFGGICDEWGNSVQQTTDGGYIIVGERETYLGKQTYVIKTDSTGTEEWNKTFGGLGYSESANSICQTKDGGYIITGEKSEEFNPNYQDVLVRKMDSDGNEEWIKTFGEQGNNEYGYSIQQTKDGGYIIAGKKKGMLNYDIYLIKIDSDGNEEWNWVSGWINFDSGNSIHQTADGGYIITGSTSNTVNPIYPDVVLLKINSNGEEEWSKSFGKMNYPDSGYSVQQTDDGGYIIAGVTMSYGEGLDDIWLIKTDSWGTEQWNKTFGGSHYDYGYSVQQTNDGGYIIVGKTNSYGTGTDEDILLIKTNSGGIEQWNKTFDGSNYESGNSVQQTNDGGYIIVGSTNSFGVGDYDIWLVKVNKNVTPSISFVKNEADDKLMVTSTEPGLDWSDVLIQCSNGTHNAIINMTGSIEAGDTIYVRDAGLFNNVTVSITWIPTSIMLGQFNFSIIQIPIYYLTTDIIPSGSGYITLDPSGGIYDGGIVVTITAHSHSGYVFSHWSGDASGNNPTIQVTMDSNKSITAHFTMVPSPPPNQPPTVNITSPFNGSTVLGIITIQGKADDADGTIQKVEIKIDSGSWIIVTGTTSWSYTWDTTKLDNGRHTIYARSYDGENYSSIDSVIVAVNNPIPEKPDLYLNDGDISFSNQNPDVGNDVTIYAVVHNKGGSDATANVKFYDGNPETGTLIGTDSVSIVAHGTDTAFVKWKAIQEGNHTIYVVVSDCQPAEETESNNKASNTIAVGIPVQPILRITLGQFDVVTIKEGKSRDIPIKVYCYKKAVKNIHIQILEDGNLTIIPITPSMDLNPWEQRDYLINIKVPKLDENVTVGSKTILIQAVGDEGVMSNTENITVIISKPSGIPSFTTALAIAGASIGALMAFFRRRYGNGEI